MGHVAQADGIVGTGLFGQGGPHPMNASGGVRVEWQGLTALHENAVQDGF